MGFGAVVMRVIVALVIVACVRRYFGLRGFESVC
jgi:hypothetical protein